MFLSEWREFPSAPCLAGKKNFMTARVSMLLKSRATLTCFRASFLPGRAKDLSAPQYCFNPLNAKLNPICNLLALLGIHLILHVSKIRVNPCIFCLKYVLYKIYCRNNLIFREAQWAQVMYEIKNKKETFCRNVGINVTEHIKSCIICS